MPNSARTTRRKKGQRPLSRLTAGLLLFLGWGALFSLTAQESAACPACQSVLTSTWSERYAKLDVALLGRLVSSQPASSAKGTSAQSVFRILQTARPGQPPFQVGQRVTLPRSVDASPGSLFLLTARKAGKKSGSLAPLKWDDPTEVSEAAYYYITQAPSPEVPGPQRLKFFLRFFEFPDPLVADDAYNEFAKAPFKEIKALADVFPRDKLRRWLRDPHTKQTRIGLYGLMLGLCGKPEDAQLLKEILSDHSKEFRLGIEGVIAGYLFLTGEKGVALIEQVKLRDPHTPFGETYMAIQGLRIIDTYGDGRISRERLKKSFRLLLDRPEAAELILPDLARWKDWAVMERLVQLYGRKNYNSPGFKRAVIRFLLVASREKYSGESPPAHVSAAKRHLAALRRRDPKTYRYVQQSLF